MSEFDREIRRQRARLLRLERNGASEIVRSYQAVQKRMRGDLRELTRRIQAERAAGREVNADWLFRQDRYRSLIDQLDRATLRFLQDALKRIVRGKNGAVRLAIEDTPKLTLAALGPGPTNAQATVLGTFGRLPEATLQQIVTNAAADQPLGLLIAEIAKGATQPVVDALAYGVAAGRGVRDIARDVRQAAGIPLTRALSISRTEVLRAYRQTAQQRYAASRAVKGWTWYAELSSRTCPICWAMHGTKHGPQEMLDSHVNCRCTMVPRTLSWSELGFDVPDQRPAIATGPERFAALDEADKLAVLGRSRLDAYNAGAITLEDLVRPTRSPRWGDGLRQATLAELGV